MATDAVTPAALLEEADAARNAGHGARAAALYAAAADRAGRDGDLDAEVSAVLGLARCQEYNVTPGALPVQLYGPYARAVDPVQRARLAAALARCWAYSGEPRRARPFADEALRIAEAQDAPAVLADCLDAALAAYWGPDDLGRRRSWALRLGDVAAHLPDLDARLQAHLWALTLAWEVLDLARMHREARALELMAAESPRAAFFAASRRLALDLLSGRADTLPALRAAAEAASAAALIPDSYSVLHNMTGYTALIAGDRERCAAEAPAFEEYAVSQGVAAVRAEAAMIWLGAARLDKVREMVAPFTSGVLAELPRDGDWLLTLQCVLEGGLATGDRRLVADVARLLRPYAGRAVINAGAVMFHGVTDDTLARAAALLGDADETRRLAAEALATYERIGAVWWRDRLRRASEPLVETGATTVRLVEQAGGLWRVGRPGHEVTLPDLRGLHQLRVLVSRPDTPVPAVDLAAGAVAVPQAGLEVLDDHARRAYRRRLAELDDQLGSAPVRADTARQGRLREERTALLAQLNAAAGLGGRTRTTGSTVERARVAVRKTLIAAVARIAEADPWLGRHLRDRLRTGTECRYETDPDHPVTWIIRAT